MVYQVVWARELQIAFGVNAFAIAAVLSAYFLGLAFGAFAGGRISDRIVNPARAYGLAEVLIGVIAIAITPWIERLDILLRPFDGFLHDEFWPLQISRFAMTLIILFLPTSLLGATFPLLLRGVIPTIGIAGRKVSDFYAMNTFGAASGVLIAGFVLIPQIGLHSSTFLAGTVSILAGIAAIILSARPASANGFELSPRSEERDKRLETPMAPAVILLVMGISGGVALGLEVLWTRVLIQSISSTAYVFSILLAIFLIGIALGSAWVRRYVDTWKNLPAILAVCQIVVAALTLIAPLVLVKVAPFILEWVRTALGIDPIAWHFPIWSAWAAMVLLPTAVIFGVMFPLAAKLIARHDADVGGALGKLYTANTLGGVVGSFLFGFACLPVLGLYGSMLVTVFMQLLLAVILMFTAQLGAEMRVKIMIPIAMVALSVFILPPDPVEMLLRARVKGTVLHHVEDYYGHIVVSKETQPIGEFLRLSLNGAPYSDTGPYGVRYMRLQAHIPALLSGRPKKGLVIGLGVGTTAGALATHPDIEVTVVELSRAVVDAQHYFSKTSKDVLRRGNVRIVIDDGRNYLLRHTDKNFDVITLEPPPPTHAGIANLYSRDFYALMHEHLTENGIVAQWIPLHTQLEHETKMLLASFISVFPDANLWLTERGETLITGSKHPVSLDPREIKAMFQSREVAESLAEIGINDPMALAATHLLGGDDLKVYVNNAFIMTDDRPVIEYRSPVINYDYPVTLEHLLRYRSSAHRVAVMFGMLEGDAALLGEQRSELIKHSLARSLFQ